MDKITCPICTRLNDPLESRCWFCSADLHPAAPAPDVIDDGLSDLKEGLDAGNSILSDEILQNIEEVTPSNDIPEWLARIRARESAERAAQVKDEEQLKAQKKSQGGIPDWLSSLGEGIDFSIPIEASLPSEIGTEESVPVSPIEEKEIAPALEDESDWLESLKSWQPGSSQEVITNSEDFVISAEDEVSETSLGETGQVFDISRPFEPASEIELPVIERDSEESININKDEIDDSALIISPELEVKDQIAQVFDDLQSQVEPEEIVIPDSNENVINSEKIEFAPPSGVFEGEDTFSERLSSEPIITSSAEDSVSDTPLPAQTAIPEYSLDKEATSEPFNPEELPEWLITEQPVEKPKPGPKPTNASEVNGLNLTKPEKANLPVWLEAIRPIEAVEMAATNSGPSNAMETNEILSTLEAVVADRKMPKVSGKPSDLGGGLKVTERQKSHIAILSAVVANIEGEKEEVFKSVQIKSHVLWRALLGLVFVTITLFGIIKLNDYGLQPALFPEEVVHTFDQINSLPLDKPVLIAGDFEAGLAGEIRWSSQPLIEHLMRRNLAITLISTNPVDTALLYAQITNGLGAVPEFQIIEKVVDLGYLPGGAIAVQSLNGEFTKAVPLTADLTPTSTHVLLSSVNSLKDFSAVIVITDDSENARVWIEQIQPQIADTPLLMVTSAQAAPLIQPYYQSGQVAGLVSGLPGGLIYERILQKPGDASSHLSSLQMLSVLMAGLILVGGFISMVKPVEFGGRE
jgi:hypothetical protein